MKRASEESDPHTDYFPGCFFDNITQALNYDGSAASQILGRFASPLQVITSAINRWNLAGKVALVIQAEAGGNYKLEYEGVDERYNPFYAQRDIELVS